MQPKQPSAFRRFVPTPAGRATLVALAILLVFATYVYVSALIAIPAMLLFGLAIPIWGGLKRGRYLAISGLVILLLVTPISTVVITQDIRSPVSPVSSLTTISGTSGHALLVNASVSPYTGTTTTNFTWQVTVDPTGIPQGNSSPVWLELYLSTCPGATNGSALPSWCSAGAPFTVLNYTFSGNLTAAKTIEFHHTIGSNGIWDWQMGVYTRNATTGALFYQNLVGDPSYNAIEGPVVGDFGTTYFALLPTLYLDTFLFLGAPFYIVLLLYLFFKMRERRRKEAARRSADALPPAGAPSRDPARGPRPPPSGGKTTEGSADAAPPTAKESTCPNCSAVVYENETTCWKCGASLGSSAPLPSGTDHPE